jgi:hypothetical protein
VAVAAIIITKHVCGLRPEPARSSGQPCQGSRRAEAPIKNHLGVWSAKWQHTIALGLVNRVNITTADSYSGFGQQDFLEYNLINDYEKPQALIPVNSGW